MDRNKRKKLIIWALAMLPLVVVAFSYGALPAEIPTGWSLSGPTRYTEKNDIWYVACLGVVIAAFFTILPSIDPKGENYIRFKDVYETLIIVMVVFCGCITGIVISESFRPGEIHVGRLITLLVGLLFLFLGNLMPKIKNNFFLGIRNPWTLSDPDIWNSAHRVGGHVFFIFGLCVAVLALLPIWAVLIYIMTVVGVVAITVVPYIYSYILYRRKKKRAIRPVGEE